MLVVWVLRGYVQNNATGVCPQQYSREEPLYSVRTTVYGQMTGDGAVALKLAARSEVAARRRSGNCVASESAI